MTAFETEVGPTSGGSTVRPGNGRGHFGSDEVSKALAGVIRSTPPGQRLPTERDLVAMLGVSRTALRDRLQTLEGLGVICRRQGAGTFVVQQLDPTGLAFALDLAITGSHLPLEALHSVRVALERQAGLEAARVGDPVLIGYLEKALNTIVESDDGEVVDEADFEFHYRLLRAAGNPALSFFADALAGVLHEALRHRRAEMRARMNDRDREVMANVHRAIFVAVRAGDPSRAAAAVDAHFDAYRELVEPAVQK